MRIEKLRSLVEDFAQEATRIGTAIISELWLPLEKKTVLPQTGTVGGIGDQFNSDRTLCWTHDRLNRLILRVFLIVFFLNSLLAGGEKFVENGIFFKFAMTKKDCMVETNLL